MSDRNRILCELWDDIASGKNKDGADKLQINM